MMSVDLRFATLLSFALVCSAPAGAVSAQQGTIVGQITDAETGAPLAGASVEALGAGGPQGSNDEGRYSLTVAPGTYSVVVRLIGYETTRVDGVAVAVGASVDVDISLRSQALVLNPVVITASRRQEKALDAPASIATVSADEIERVAAVTVADHVTTLPGVDRAQTGLAQGTVVARGFNNVFSGALLTIIDNRYARIPSLRFNAYSMFPTNDLDLDRIELSLGPGAALYGPNAASGVMHLITSSPLDKQGSTVSLAGGERSLFHGQFRTAVAPTENFGLKISGQYMQGDDWEYDDPAEAVAREAGCRHCVRDNEARRYSVDARMDFRFAGGGDLVFNGGSSTLASGVDMTGIGAFQVKNWGYNYLQSRFTKGRLFAQYFLNMTNSGGAEGGLVTEGTFGLRTGAPVIDQSRTMAAQFQYGMDLGSWQSFTYGVDWQRTEPRTGGTINGRNEDDDMIAEIGGYLHSETSLGEKLALVTAIRVDHHSRLDDLNISPRAALVFKPAEDQNFRITYNQAFATPTANNLFLDIVAATLPPPINFYAVQARGVPSTGYTFTHTCPGGYNSLCMRSPLAPGQLPANAVLFWDGLLELLARLAPDLAPIVGFLQMPGAIPEDPEIGTVLRRLDINSQEFNLDAGPTAVDPLESTIYTTIEGGYKGLLAGRVLLAADVYKANIQNFVGPLRVETPNVFLDPESTGAFVFHRLGPLIQAGLITQQQVAEIIANLAAVPIGTVAPDQSEDHNLMVTYRNFGEVDYWGADLAAQILVSDRFRINAGYSFQSDDCFDDDNDGKCTGLHDIALNAPRNKGSLGFTFDDRALGLTLQGRVRMTDGFPMNSGVYVGEVGGYEVVDASIGYELPFRRATRLSLTANNILNNLHREFVGAPELGRLLLLRVQYDF
ncbi:MAG: TonB-dependent receptor [Gemmatimonadetes bacterium]|nr:TonB-dependent receptor [Gemmatimonadota bacterium]MYB99405.1 TonB-dependent receptor [Gemmatimonadota bacterium]MYI46900.1 TonB-dependent receptor [Gemmatimonadota bacterium]